MLVSDPELQTDSTEDDPTECNGVEYEEHLYSILNFSGNLEANPDRHNDFQEFYSNSRKNNAYRLQKTTELVEQLRAGKSRSVAKISDFSRESVQNFIPLDSSSVKKKSRQKFSRQYLRNSCRNNFEKSRLKTFPKKNLGAMPREYETDKTSVEGKETHSTADDEVITLSDSDTCEVVASSKDYDDDVLSIDAGDDILESLNLNAGSGNSHQTTMDVPENVSSRTSSTCVKVNETEADDVSLILCSDVDTSKPNVTSECDESDIEILPTPSKPSPPVIFLDSGDEVSRGESPEVLLANIDTDACIIVSSQDSSSDVPSTAVTNVTSANNVTHSAVAHSWTDAMIKFYCEPSGDKYFDHQILQKTMSRSAEKWQVDALDIAPMAMSKRLLRIRCSNCHQRGHMAVACTDPPHIRVCSLCSQGSHNYTRCPNRLCSRCGVSSNMPSRAGCSSCISQNLECQHCRSEEHILTLCPEVWRCYHHTTDAVFNSLGDHPAENLKPNSEQCCPHCGRWGHKYEDCNSTSWFGGPCQQVLPFRVPQPAMNGWASQRARGRWNAPRNTNWFHGSAVAARNQNATPAYVPWRMYLPANRKADKVGKLKRLWRKRKKRQKLAEKEAAHANGVQTPA